MCSQSGTGALFSNLVGIAEVLAGEAGEAGEAGGSKGGKSW